MHDQYRYFVILCFCLFLSYQQQIFAAELLTIKKAQVVEQITGEPPMTSREVGLPYFWPEKRYNNKTGIANFTIPFTSTKIISNQALFIENLGGSYEVRLNGELLAAAGEFGNNNISYNSYPLLVNLPNILINNLNVLTVKIYSPFGMFARISTVYIGDYYKLKTKYNLSQNMKIFEVIIFILCLIIGLFTLFFYFIETDNTYLYYSLAEFSYGIFVLGGLVINSPIPFAWFYSIYMSFHFAALICITILFLNLARFNHKLLKFFKLFCLFSLVCFVVIMLLFNVYNVINLYTHYYISMYILFAIIAIISAIVICKKKNTYSYFLALLIFLYGICLIHDALVYFIFSYFRSLNNILLVHWDKYVWPLFSIFMSSYLFKQIYDNSTKLKLSNVYTKQMLEQQELELNVLYQKQKEQEKSKAILVERERLAQDIHDGISNQLISTLHLLQSGHISIDQASEQLKKTHLQLKLMVDALDVVEADIGLLLGDLRHRFSKLFEQAKINLDWDVDKLPLNLAWIPEQYRHFQLIIYEALCNIIEHSQANNCTLQAKSSKDEIHIKITDNGCGCQLNHISAGKGFHNMRIRAEAINARLVLESTLNQGFILTLSIPLVMV